MGLFKKKSTSKEAHHWYFLSSKGKTLLLDTTFNLPLKEDIILRKCLDFFDDPDPCYIHRGAVIARLYFELEEVAEMLPKGEPLSVNQLSGCVMNYLELPELSDTLVIT